MLHESQSDRSAGSGLSGVEASARRSARRLGFAWKLFSSYALLALLISASIGTLVYERTGQVLTDNIQASLRDGCQLLVPHAGRRLVGGVAEARDPVLSELASQTGLRITVIDGNGRVIADSEEAATLMGNHGDRPEVQQAMQTGVGESQRLSATVRRRLGYVAVALYQDADQDAGQEPIGVLRLSVSLTEVDRQLHVMRNTITAGAAIGAFLALILGLFMARRITRPLAAMTRTAEAMSSGEYGSRVLELPDDELGVLGDALNRLGAELTLRISDTHAEEAQLRAMLSGMVEGVIAVDEDGRLLFSNRAAHEQLDIRPLEGGIQSARGMRLVELVRIPELEELIKAARTEEGAQHREFEIQPANGARTLSVHARRFDPEVREAQGAGSSGMQVGVVVVFEDVSELRLLERVRRDFVTNVSHELKTPLTSIRGYVETLMDGALHDEDNNERFLAKINDNVTRLNHLVADLLSLARIESQSGVLDIEALDWRPIVAESVRRHGEAASSRGIQCELRASDEDLAVLGDHEALVLIVDNLIANAVQYSPDGAAVEVHLESAGGRAILTVTDHGIGIPSADRARIFERFYRVDKARSRAHGGTGLGLSIVKHHVQAMHGEVLLESRLGAGSSFKVSLPMPQRGA